MEQTLGDKLLKLRRAQGLTQTQVAEYLEVTSAAVSAYERDANQPSLAALKKLAELYHVSADFLLGIEGGLDAERARREEELVRRLQRLTQDFLRHVQDRG